MYQDLLCRTVKTETRFNVLHSETDVFPVCTKVAFGSIVNSIGYSRKTRNCIPINMQIAPGDFRDAKYRRSARFYREKRTGYQTCRNNARVDTTVLELGICFEMLTSREIFADGYGPQFRPNNTYCPLEDWFLYSA